MIFGPIMMIAVLAAIVAVVVLIGRWAGGNITPGGSYYPPQLPQKTALDILDERFVRGEIEKDEFEEKKRILSSQ